MFAIGTSCRRAAATICPAPLPLWAPKRLAPPSRRQRNSSFPRPTRSNAHRCSRLMRQHGGEQSGLVTLTFDLLTLKVVSESRVTWATSVPILVFLGLSVLDLGPMYATDRRQTTSSLNAQGHNNGYVILTK